MNRRAGIVALAVLGVAFAAGLYWLAITGFFGHVEGWIVPTVFLGTALLAVARLLGLFRFHRHQGVALLSCRRFGSAEGGTGRRNSWHEAMLSEACHKLTLPITLRDASVRGTSSIVGALEIALLLVLVGLGMAGFLWLGIRLSDHLDGRLGLLAVFASYVAVWLSIAFVNEKLLTSVATYRGLPNKLRETVRRVIESRRSRSDLFVVRCTDRDWEASVEALLEEVSLAVIDLTGSSENLDWEVDRCLAVLGPDRVLFLQETADDEHAGRVRGALPAPAGPAEAADYHCLRYGRAWVGQERAHFEELQSHRATGTPSAALGPRSQAVGDSIREWIIDAGGLPSAAAPGR